MTIYLLANVGNSDLELRHIELPDRGTPWTIRSRAAYVYENLDHFAGGIHLPLLSPTLRWLYEHRQAADAGLSIALFASDQLEVVTSPSDREKDTKPVADVIKAFLGRPEADADVGHKSFRKLANKKVSISTIEGNPADYANMLAFYSRALPVLAARMQSDDTVYLEVSGGTPAMTSMLILVAVEVFGERVHTLYVDRGENQPNEVSVAQELFARRARRTLREQIDLYAYAIAQNTLTQSGAIIHGDETRRKLISKLLDYADRRLAFDFDEARAALVVARQLTTGNDQARVKFWLTQLENPDISVNLAELLHSMRIKHEFGDYADFVQRIFRFQEASFRYMAESMGLRYVDPRRDEYVDLEWVKGQAGLTDFLRAYADPTSGGQTSINYEASLNRKSLGAIVDFFVSRDDKWHHWQETARMLHGLSKVAELRNRGLSGHGFRGISGADVERVFGAHITELLAQLNAIYKALFEREPSDDPYMAVNEFLHRLIDPAQAKSGT